MTIAALPCIPVRPLAMVTPPSPSICRPNTGPTKHQSKDTFLAWAQQVGPHTHQQVTAIFAAKAHEEQAFRTLKGLQSLATRYGLSD